MKRALSTITLIAALSGLTTATQAQTVVWSQNFDSLSTGTYGAHTTDFAGDTNNPANPANNIVSPGIGGTGNAMAVTFNTVSGTTINLQTATLATAPSGATSANLSDYVLSFDMNIQGVDVSAGYGGLQFSVQANDGGIFGVGAVSPFVVPAGGTAGSGYQHYSYNLGTFSAGSGGTLDPSTATSLAFGIGAILYGNNMTASPETLLVDNVQISMVPEPSTFALLAAGLGLLAGWRRFRRVSC